MPRLQAAPAKHYVFTLNNPTFTHEQLLVHFADWPLQYAVFQLEVGDNGTPHFQGYLEFNRKMRITGILRLPGSARMHLEKRRGTRAQARDYATKEDSRTEGPWEVGDWLECAQGRRSDILAATYMLTSGASLVDVAVANPATYVRYYRGLQSFINIQPRTRVDKPAVTLIYGPPGCGKTRLVRDGEDFEQLWVSPPGSALKWFDDYQNQEAVLIDDFDGKLSQVPLSTVLQILDRYAIRVAVKGGYVWWTPRRMYVTTNYHPREWYDWHSREPQYAAVVRRFTNVVYWPFEDPIPEPFLLTPESPAWDNFWANTL